MKQLIICIYILFPILLSAQSVTQNCIGAVAVCQNTYTVNTALNGIGTGTNEINAANSCLSNGEQNSMWYTFTVQTAGSLNFVITPTTATDNYNWALYDLTGQSCNDIFNNASLEVACNADLPAFSGTTGMDNNLFGLVPGFTWELPVNVGETFVLNISRYSGNDGFSIDFGGSTAVLFNPIAPSISFIEPVFCGNDKLKVHFNKNIACNSVTTSNFQLGGFVVNTVTPINCNAAGFTQIFEVELTQPLIATGNYGLVLSGMLDDECGTQSVAGVELFNVAAPTALAGNDLAYCSGDNINVVLGDVNASYSSNVTFSWTSTSPIIQNAISQLNIQNPTLNIPIAAIDSAHIYFTVQSGSCMTMDTLEIVIRDCCVNYDAQITAFQDINCWNASTGSATATAIGSISGQPAQGFSYIWSNNQTSFNATGLSSGIKYTVTVTDPVGCSDTTSITLTQPATAVTASTIGSQVPCFGDNTGTVDLSVSGGTPPYSFNWNNSATTEDLSGLVAGTYTVTIVDANNCTITESATVTQPATPLVVNSVGSTVACGMSNGTINLTVSGGGPPYIYNWSNGAPTQNLINLTPGTYTVTVTDVFGCNRSESVTVGTLSGLTATTTSTDIPCNTNPTGTATVNVNGGLAPYTYLWSNNATTQTINGLSQGLYTVTITDATACSITASTTVNVVSSIQTSSSVTPVNCHGGNDGSITLNVAGNNGPFSYLWSNNQTTSTINNLSAGNYIVTISDQSGCSTIETINVSEPSTMTINLIPTATSCAGNADGFIQTNVFGGTSPYSYSWSNNTNSKNPTGLSSASYTVTVTDAKGCTKTATALVTQPPILSANSTVMNTTCSGTATGAITLNAIGGTAPYTYSWNNGLGTVQNPSGLAAGAYSVTITDSKNCTYSTSITVGSATSMNALAIGSQLNCFGDSNGTIALTVGGGTLPYTFNWDNGAGTNQTPTGLVAGTYNVTITDANGCTFVTGSTVTQPSSGVTATATPIHIPCNGTNTGSINLAVSGGTGPYTYNWTNGAGTSQNLSNIIAGTYIVTVTDSKNCTTTASATVTQSPSMTLMATGTALNCFGDNNGNITLTVNGGTAPYSYAWSNGAGTVQNPSNLVAGTYTVTVTDASNCTKTTSAIISQPSSISISNTINHISCNGNADGSIQLSVSGGVGPYTYNWSNGLGTIQNPVNLSAGSYTVTVTDASNCTNVVTLPVNEPTLLTISTVEIPSTCGNSNGNITVTPSGGTQPYIYTWSPNITVSTNTNMVTGLSSGVYGVTVTDANNCIASSSIIEFLPSENFDVTATITDPKCDPQNGEIEVNIGSTNGPFIYSWSANANTLNTNKAINLGAGTYTLNIKDNDNCDTTLTFTLATPTLLTATETIQQPTCGQTNGTIEVNVQTGVAPYTYAWSANANAGDTNMITNLLEDVYMVTITDAIGCVLEQTYTLTGSSLLTTSATITAPNCTIDGTITLNPTMGVAPYTYTWSTNANTGNSNVASGLSGDIYFVTITDATLCTIDTSFELVKEGEFDIFLDNISDVLCFGDDNGTIDISTNSMSSNITYNWSNGVNVEDINGLTAGDYTVTVTDLITGCVEIETFTLTEGQAIDFETSNDVTIQPGQSTTLEVTSNNPNITFNWIIDGGVVQNGTEITVSPLQTTTYIVSGTIGNCPSVAKEIVVTVSNDGELYIVPEAFSPNGDGQNDIFRVFANPGNEVIELKVFNRWGEWMNKDGNKLNWDGRYRGQDMPNGAYPFIVVIRTIDGEEKVQSGQIILVR